MSRIGKKPVLLPKGVTASVEGQTVKVKGPKGELSVKLVQEVSASIGDDGITVAPRKEMEKAAQMWGLSRTLVNNLVTGVTNGFTQKPTREHYVNLGRAVEAQHELVYQAEKAHVEPPDLWKVAKARVARGDVVAIN